MSANRWQYGDSWEKYPIRLGETWVHHESGSKVSVADLRDGIPSYMLGAEMVYCDPPWSKGNANAFVTKAGLKTYVVDYAKFMDALFQRIREIEPRVCYLEIGTQHLSDFCMRIERLFLRVQVWPITYYRRHKCYLVRGGQEYCVACDYSGMDDEDTPFAAVRAESPKTVADMCTGCGLTMLAAHRAGTTFYGTELNKRRLAVAIDRVAQMGVRYEKHNPDSSS